MVSNDLSSKLIKLYRRIDSNIAKQTFINCSDKEIELFKQAIKTEPILTRKVCRELPILRKGGVGTSEFYKEYRKRIVKYIKDNIRNSPKIPVISTLPARVYNALLVKYGLISKSDLKKVYSK